MTASAARPIERIVFQNGRVEVGAFRCPARHPEFRHAGAPIRDHFVFAFPRTRVWIRHEGGRAFATDTHVVTFYNPRQRYERQRLDDVGDMCEWFAVDREVAEDAVRAHEPALEAGAPHCFRFSHAQSDAAAYLAQRQLFAALAGGAPLDALGVEERVLWLLERVLDSAYRPWRLAQRGAPAETAREREAVRDARILLAARFRESLSLPGVARAVGLSRYRLCRAFRRATGTTLHAYRGQLRLRAALGALASRGVDLTELALDLGYSSHSHFTSHFRRVFGLPPSHARRCLASGAGRLPSRP